MGKVMVLGVKGVFASNSLVAGSVKKRSGTGCSVVG